MNCYYCNKITYKLGENLLSKCDNCNVKFSFNNVHSYALIDYKKYDFIISAYHLYIQNELEIYFVNKVISSLTFKLNYNISLLDVYNFIDKQIKLLNLL